MQTTYDFLDALELDERAVERDIRRAYARKLKLIDQEAQPAAFQVLREAYEVALDWARWKLAQAADELAAADAPAAEAPAVEAPIVEAPAAEAPAAVQPDANPEPALPDARQLGAEVFARLGESAKALAATDKLGDAVAWRAALEARFADEELVNIDARIYFEAYVASLLASGWQRGHEALLIAAKDAFAWAGDRRRLWQLGQAGRFVDQALEERQLFEAQPPGDQTRMRDLAKMLRQVELPNTRRIRAAMPDTERMLGRFPALMSIVTSMENAERWRSIYRESGGAPIVAEAEEAQLEPAEPKRTFSTMQGIVLFLLLLAVLRAVFNYSGGGQDAGRGRFTSPPANMASAPVVPQAMLDKIVPPVRYTAPPGTDLRTLDVVYKVFLNADRTLERVQNWQTSGNPGFDQAVGDALRAARAFPPGTPRVFEVRYTGSMTVKGGRPGARTGDAPASPPVAPPALRPIPAETLRRHIPPILFTPGPGAREGDYTGIYRVTLDAAGKVKNVGVVKSTGDGRLDWAVMEAVRDAKPFPPGMQGFEFTYATKIVRKPRPEAEAREAPPEGRADQEQPEPAPPAPAPAPTPATE